MTRGIILGTYARRRRVSMLALVAALVVLATASTPSSVSAATESTISSDRGLYHSADAGPSYSAEVSTLTNDVGQTRGSAEEQLPLGIGLLAVGLLGLVYAAVLSTGRRTRPRATAMSRPDGENLDSARFGG